MPFIGPVILAWGLEHRYESMGIMAEIHPITAYDVRHGEDLFAYPTAVDADEVSIPIIVHENQAFHNILITFTLKGCVW